MNELLKNRKTIFIGIVLILTLGVNQNFEYYLNLDKPWFAPPIWGVYMLYSLVGLSIYRSFLVFLKLAETKDIIKLQKIYTLLWILYVIGIFFMLASGLPLLFPFGILLLLSLIFKIVYDAFDKSIELTKKLNLAFFILVYMFVTGLYIASNNPIF